MDYNSAAIGGLLHDFYSEPWLIDGKINNKKRDNKLSSKHGFAHAKDALNNSKIHFEYLLNKKIENIIVRHMFPLNITPPRYLEAWVVTIADKYISLSIFKNPKELPKYIGIRTKK